MANRSRDRHIGPIMGATRVEYWSPHYINGTTYIPTLYFKDEDMDDIVTPNFHQRSARGEIFNNPVLYTVESQQIVGSMSINTRRVKSLNPTVYGTDNYRWFGDGVLQATRQESGGSDIFDHRFVPIGDSTAESLAKNFALANIDSTPYDFAEDSFEIRETLRFIRNPVRAIRDLSREFYKVVRGKSKTPKRLAQRLSDAWLEYRFAFSPLVRTTVEAVDYFNDKHIERPQRRTARGGGKDENDVLETVREYVIGGSNYHDYGYHTRRTFNARAGIMYEVSNPINDWNFQTGLRAKDIPETIWAVLPYSFMVDRVLNLSNGIRGLTNLLDPKVKILAAWVSSKDERLTTVRLVDKVTGGFEVRISGSQTAERKSFQYVRSVWNPTVSDAVPPFTPGGLVSDAESIADLLAIIYKNIT